METKRGTTTLAMIAKDAIVMATDSKASLGYMVAEKRAKKLYQLDDHIGFTTAGGAGDAQAIVRLLKAQFKLYKLDRGPISLKAAASLLSNILQGSKYFPYMNQFIMAGFDTKPWVFSFDPLGAYDSGESYQSTGSGSPFVYGVMEAEFKENMPVEDALKLAVKAIKAAIQRDIASGGEYLQVAVIDKDGYKELGEQELKKYM
jgi:proteasome beta subunit